MPTLRRPSYPSNRGLHVRLRRTVLLSGCLVLSLLSCGSSKTFDVTVRQQSKPGAMPRSQVINADAAADGAIQTRRVLAFIAAGIHARKSPPSQVRPSPVVEAIPTATTTVPAATSPYPCGGDYPPCYVAQRESGNTYTAYNPTGCGGNGCYGRWQASGDWACHFDLPCDIAHWTPEQQDFFARTLWDHGAGCSNWAAC